MSKIKQNNKADSDEIKRKKGKEKETTYQSITSPTCRSTSLEVSPITSFTKSALIASAFIRPNVLLSRNCFKE